MNSLISRIFNRGFSELLRVFIPLEKILLYRVKTKKKLKPIFIISTPRAGSTITYQIVTTHFLINYIANFGAFFYHSLITGFRLQSKFLSNKAHNSFFSVKGKTVGLNGPHECGKFWRMWFSNKTDFVGSSYINTDNFNNLLKTISFLDGYQGRPIVFKNTVNSLRLQALFELFPDSLIIYCRRNPLQTSYSILRHRIKENNDKDKWWAAKPKEYEELKEKPYPEQIAKQVYFITKQIENDLKLWPSQQILELSYEEMCVELNINLNRIHDFFKQNDINVKIRENSTLPNLNNSNKEFTDRDFYLLKNEIEKLSW